MNESLHPDSAAATTAVDLLNQAAQGAHGRIDHIANSAEPVVRQLGQRVGAAADAVHAKTDPWRNAGTRWVAGTRSTVRGNPLIAIAAAFALGAVIARITR